MKQGDSMLTTAQNVYRNWLFQPSEPTNLAICRILFFGFLTGAFVTGGHGLRTLDAPWLPISFFWLLGLKPMSFESYSQLVIALRICVLCATIGLFTRTSCCLSFLLGWYLIGLEANFGKVLHSPVLPLFALAAFAFSRSGDAFSVDAILRRYRGPSHDRLCSGEYTWPLRFLQTIFCLMFLGAGLCKMRKTGLEWIFSDNMQNIILLHFYWKDQPPLDWGRWIAQIPWFCQFLAGCAVGFELFAPLALVNRWARFILVGGLFLMQLGNILFLGVYFQGWMFCYAIWIPWLEIGKAITTRWRRMPIAYQRAPAVGLVK